jgi:LuxR family maltose regulon positive regulatory protein
MPSTRFRDRAATQEIRPVHAVTDFESFRNTVVDAASRGDSASVLAAIRPVAHNIAGEHGVEFRELMAGLPIEIWHNDPEVAAALGESYRAHGSPRGQSALGYFRAAEAAIAITPGVPAHCLAAVLIGHTAALRSLGRFAAAKQKSADAYEVITTKLAPNVPIRVGLGARWSLEEGILRLHDGEFESARAHLEYAHGLAHIHLTRAEHIECLGGLALVDGVMGELERGLEQVRYAKELAVGTELLESGYGAPALMAEVMISNERYDIARSALAEPQMLEAACRTEWEPGAYSMSAHLKGLSGNFIESLDQVERSLKTSATWDHAAYGTDFANLLRAALLLGLGHAEESWAILQTLPAHENHVLCPARITAQLRLGHGDLLGAQLAIQECEALGGAHVSRTAADIQLIRSAIEHVKGNYAASDVAADRAFIAMARTGARAPMQRISASTLHTLAQRASLRPQNTEVRGMLTAILSRTVVDSGDAAEPLSPRERLVLAQVQRGSTVAVMAAELFISPNTIKTHLRRLYRKLGVSTREEAIRAARSLGLDSEITRSSPVGIRDAADEAVL